jgi:hypothetical protein
LVTGGPIFSESGTGAAGPSALEQAGRSAWAVILVGAPFTVRGVKEQVIEGKMPQITIEQAGPANGRGLL